MAEELNANQDGTSSTEQGEAASKVVKPAKVELDLDDAPFLEEEESEKEPEPEKEPVAAAPRKEAEPSGELSSSEKERLLARKKKIIIAGVAAVVLLVAGVCLNLFLFSAPSPPPPPEPEKILAAPESLPEAPVPLHTLQLEPFWIEIKDTEGAIRFLTITLSIPTDNPTLFAEMSIKKLVLRDALFYYLRNQPIIALTDAEKAQAFKGDLLTVMNEHLASGKVSELFIQDYLMQ